MSSCKPKVVDAAEEKHGSNRLETGLQSTHPAVIVGNAAAGWDDATRRSVVLLRALARLTADAGGESDQGFGSLQLAEAFRKIKDPYWGRGAKSDEDPDSLSRLVRATWKELETQWPSKVPGLVERLRSHGVKAVPRLTRKVGGGSGNLTTYGLTFDQCDQPEAAPATPSLPDHPVKIAYFTEEVDAGTRLIQALGNGCNLGTGKAKLALVVSLTAIAAIGLALIAAGSGFFSTLTLNAAAGLIVSGWMFHHSLNAFYRLPNSRIEPAPWWLQGLSAYDDRLLELRPSVTSDYNELWLLRYVAECPICQGKIRIQAGKREFHGRLVGFCNQAPNEHLFTFDHISKEGHWLRSN